LEQLQRLEGDLMAITAGDGGTMIGRTQYPFIQTPLGPKKGFLIENFFFFLHLFSQL
jgi:hypothetical protein